MNLVTWCCGILCCVELCCFVLIRRCGVVNLIWLFSAESFSAVSWCVVVCVAVLFLCAGLALVYSV